MIADGVGLLCMAHAVVDFVHLSDVAVRAKLRLVLGAFMLVDDQWDEITPPDGTQAVILAFHTSTGNCRLQVAQPDEYMTLLVNGYKSYQPSRIDLVFVGLPVDLDRLYSRILADPNLTLVSYLGEAMLGFYTVTPRIVGDT